MVERRNIVTVTSGVPFDIELGSAPGTGYIWQLQSLPAGVKLVGSDFAQVKNSAIGDPALQVFHLETECPGHFSLHFELKRRWEAQAIEQYIVNVESS